MADKHPAEVLADELDRLYDQLDPVDDWRPVISDSGDMLRRIPALEAERDQLRADADSRQMFAVRMQALEPGGPLTADSVLALLSDCDYLASLASARNPAA